MVCILVSPCARVIKLRLTPATIDIIPKPDPPDVHRSVSVFRSLASPLTGWPKSHKYLKVVCCTRSSSALSEMAGNFRDESIWVMKLCSHAVCRLPPETDFSVVATFSQYFVNAVSGDEG